MMKYDVTLEISKLCDTGFGRHEDKSIERSDRQTDASICLQVMRYHNAFCTRTSARAHKIRIFYG